MPTQHEPSRPSAMRLRALVRLAAAALAVALPACISTDSEVLEAGEGCDELASGNGQALQIDPQAKEFVLASREIAAATDTISEEVFRACAGIAVDLGAEDTWSGAETLKARISNEQRTGACDAAVTEIENELGDGDVNAEIELAVAEGECHLDFDSQAACDHECAANTTCESGSIETRCEPGKISAFCSGSCQANAICVGTAELASNCMGECQSTCVGECKGSCFHESGEVTVDDPNCMGKCASQCNGVCFGQCKVEAEAGIACGSGVRCRGTCEGTMESPVCVTEFEPPKCQVDTECYEACTARVASEAECLPTTVDVLANITSTPNLEPIVKTLEENLPALFDAAQAEGRLMQSAATRMGETGRDLNQRVEDLDGKSLACLGAASTALADSVDTLAVSLDSSVEVKGQVEIHTTAGQ